MLCKDVMYEIEKEYPLNYALSWDNVGLLVGREEKEIKKIFTGSKKDLYCIRCHR